MKSKIENNVLIQFDETDLNQEGHFDCPSNITDIGNNAFENCTKLITAEFSQVKTIEDNAFKKCNNLKSIAFPHATHVGLSAFAHCTKLERISFPQVTHITHGAFAHCVNLKNIDFPKATDIGDVVFAHCTNLENISLPRAIHINNSTFNSCTNLKGIILSHATTCDKNAFPKCTKLSSILINDIQHPAISVLLRDQLPNHLKHIDIQLISNNVWLIQQAFYPYLMPEIGRHILDFSNQLDFFKPATENKFKDEQTIQNAENTFAKNSTNTDNDPLNNNDSTSYINLMILSGVIAVASSAGLIIALIVLLPAAPLNPIGLVAAGTGMVIGTSLIGMGLFSSTTGKKQNPNSNEAAPHQELSMCT